MQLNVWNDLAKAKRRWREKKGSSSNRYAPRLPQQETKSSTKQLAPTDPETFSKSASLKRASLRLDCSFGNTGALSSTEQKGKDYHAQDKQAQRGSWLAGSWFPHSAVLLHSLDSVAMWCLSLCALFCLVSCHTNTWVDTMLSSHPFISLRTGPPITFHFACLFCLCGFFGFFLWFGFVFVVLCVVVVFAVFLMDCDGCWTMYRSFSSPLLWLPSLMAAPDMH